MGSPSIGVCAFECVLVAGSETPGEKHADADPGPTGHSRWGNLKPVPRGKQIKVEGIRAIGLVIQTIEDGLIVPDVVNTS